MNLLEMMLSGQNGGAATQLARQFGIGEDQAKAALEQLVPALGRGLQNNASQGQGLDSLIAALQKGNHTRYVEEPNVLERPETVDDGNSILGHIFGNKEVSRRVANHASEQTGIAGSLLKKMLPVVATMVMGSLGKKVLSGGLGDLAGAITGGGASRQAQSGGGLGGLVTSFLDSDKDGSIMDDLLGMAGRFMR